MTKAIRWDQATLDAFQRRTKPPPVFVAEPDQIDPKPRQAKRGKYASKKVEQGGIVFDSKKEARRWLVLEAMQAAGQISGLKRQVAFVLAPSVKLAGEKRAKPPLRYFADATYVQDGQLIVEDTKSTPTRQTAIFRAKRHLMKSVLGLEITEV